MRFALGRFAVALALSAVACSGGEGGPDARGDATPDGPVPAAPKRVDLLVVVGDRPGMLGEQQALADGFGGFLDRLHAVEGVDLHVAVTTTTGCGAGAPSGRGAGASADALGRFAWRPSDPADLPPGDAARRAVACASDSDCHGFGEDGPALPDPTSWVCEPRRDGVRYACDLPPGAGSDPWPGDLLVRPASHCRYRCTPGPADRCASMLGEPQRHLCGELCSGADCLGSCLAPVPSLVPAGAPVGDADRCEAACAKDWDCARKCAYFLGDAATCQSVCGAPDCLTACSGEAGAFPGRDFPCGIACGAAYDCEARCIASFGVPGWRCVAPGGDAALAGCVRPPDTAACPADGPAVLDDAAIDARVTAVETGAWAGEPGWSGLPNATLRRRVAERLFRCMVTVAPGHDGCDAPDRGLLAAWTALDPSGPNAAGAAAFARADALLAVLFVSDEDDCSSGVPLDPATASRCGCLADAAGCGPDGACDPSKPGPLVPVADLVAKIRSLKADPSRVVIASLSGTFSQGYPFPAYDDEATRRRYVECRCAAPAGQAEPSACEGGGGPAALGSRYRAAAESRPGEGFVRSVCGDLATAMSDLGFALAQRLDPPPQPDPEEACKGVKQSPDAAGRDVQCKGNVGCSARYPSLFSPVDCAWAPAFCTLCKDETCLRIALIDCFLPPTPDLPGAQDVPDALDTPDAASPG